MLPSVLKISPFIICSFSDHPVIFGAEVEKTMRQQKTPIFGIRYSDADFAKLVEQRAGEIKYRLNHRSSWSPAADLTAAIKRIACEDASKLTLSPTSPVLAELWSGVDLPLGLQAQLDELNTVADSDLGFDCYSYHFCVVAALRARNRDRVRAYRREACHV